MKGGKFFFLLTSMLLITYFFMPIGIDAKIVYKQYPVFNDNGRDILCDAYIVKRNDYIFKIFYESGDISQKDFPEFLSIFRRLNPDVHDVNLIHPGQRIFMPLRKLSPGTYPDQSSGMVSLPYFTISKKITPKEGTYAEYRVSIGDCISKIVSERFGDIGTQPYKEALKKFKKLNPKIEDLNRIYAGQVLYLPDLEQIEEKAITQEEKQIKDETPENKEVILPPIQNIASMPPQVLGEDEKLSQSISVKESANILNANLVIAGEYVLPMRINGEEVKIDLSKNPILEFGDTKALLVDSESNDLKNNADLLAKYWQNLKIIEVDKNASQEAILESIIKSISQNTFEKIEFYDNGLNVEVRAKWIINEPIGGQQVDYRLCINFINTSEEKVSDSIWKYLEGKNIILKEILRNSQEVNQVSNRQINYYEITNINKRNLRLFVKQLLSALDMTYSENTQVTFPYEDIQIEAYSNVIYSDTTGYIFIDFNDFQGDAIDAIKKTGLNIFQVSANESFNKIVEKILNELKIEYEINPTLLGAERPKDFNVSLQIPGYFLKLKKDKKILITEIDLEEEILNFFRYKNVKIIKVSN
ncbi:MAG: hypothetical protein HQK76_15100 [Desulfobacterales bacterium]|nr:hypothetical protein [Desulfobacterales bacterium]